jgi:hypothetical protein
MRMLTFVILTCMICSVPLAAETFQNTYMSFELPPRWACQLEQTEWVCEDGAEGPQKSAIIILTAKERGVIDRLDLYEDELSRPRPLRDTNGNPLGRSSRVAPWWLEGITCSTIQLWWNCGPVRQHVRGEGRRQKHARPRVECGVVFSRMPFNLVAPNSTIPAAAVALRTSTSTCIWSKSCPCRDGPRRPRDSSCASLC